MEHSQVQQIARETMERIREEIRPGMRLAEVRERCERTLLKLGADSFWYYGVGAFVFSGDETAKSVSGRVYRTPEKIIDEDDIVTIDLSPQVGDVWGDYARTIVLEDGAVVRRVEDIRNEEWRNGLAMEERLHAELARFATPETTFEQLYAYMNALITVQGFVNLDYLGNLGHSIERRREDRVYIEKGNALRLGDVALFTFEPHISVAGSPFGYKMENIYRFEEGRIVEL